MITDQKLQELALKSKQDFLFTLNDLDQQIASLNEIQASNPQLYTNIQSAAVTLHSALEIAVNGYMDNITQDNITQDNLMAKTHQFLTDCRRAITNAKSEFQKHPSIWFKINPIIRGILGVLSAITVIPALIIGSKYKYGVSGFSSTFFKTPKHDPNDTLAAVDLYVSCFVNDFTWAVVLPN